MCALMVFFEHIYRAEVPTFATVESGAAGLVLCTVEYGGDLHQRLRDIGRAVSRPRCRSVPARPRNSNLPGAVAANARQPGLRPCLHHRDISNTSLRTVKLALPRNLLALLGVFDMFQIHPVAWSLSYEMAFYQFGAAAWFVAGRIGSGNAARLWVSIAAVILVYYPRALFFLPGLLVATYRSGGGRVVHTLQRFPFVMLCFVLAAWGSIQAMTGPVHLVRTTLVSWATDFRLPLACVALLVAVLFMRGVVNGEGVLGRTLGSRPLIALGTISDSFYLWHIPAVALTRRLMLTLRLDVLAGPASQVVMLLIALLLSLLVSWISWRLIERAFCAWLRVHLPFALRRRAASLTAAPGAQVGAQPAMLPVPAAPTGGTNL